METQNRLFFADEKTEIAITKVKHERLTFIDIFREDLHDFIFEEDDLGRYRERIIEKIKAYGVKNWFIKMGFPIADDSVWINRHSKNKIIKTTLGIEVNKWSVDKGLEKQGYYLWENWKPEETKC